MAAPLVSGMPLATILGGDALDGADGAIAAWAVRIVSDLVRSYTRLTITPVTGATLVLQGTPGRRLVVGERPLRAVQSVTLDGQLLGVGEFSTLRSGALVRHAGWGGPDVEVMVVADIGFATIPGDLRAVVETAATRLIANPAQWRSAPAEGTEGVRVAEAATGFTLSELAVLNRYRRRAA